MDDKLPVQSSDFNLFFYKIYDSHAFLFKQLALIEVFANSMNESSCLLFTMFRV